MFYVFKNKLLVCKIRTHTNKIKMANIIVMCVNHTRLQSSADLTCHLLMTFSQINSSSTQARRKQYEVHEAKASEASNSFAKRTYINS